MLSCWKRTRYRLEWLGLSLATKLIPLCSRKSCYRLAQLAGTLLSFLDRHHYHVALSNLEVAFGDQLSARERRKIARESFQHFARTMVDLLWSSRLTPLNFLWYVELENFEETMRDTRACLVERAHGRPDHSRALRTAAKWALQAYLPSEDQQHTWDDSSTNCAGMLEFV